nr:PREDICTED: uncharacterized protein LOC103550002 [Equus przewalskii]
MDKVSHRQESFDMERLEIARKLMLPVSSESHNFGVPLLWYVPRCASRHRSKSYNLPEVTHLASGGAKENGPFAQGDAALRRLPEHGARPQQPFWTKRRGAASLLVTDGGSLQKWGLSPWDMISCQGEDAKPARRSAVASCCSGQLQVKALLARATLSWTLSVGPRRDLEMGNPGAIFLDSLEEPGMLLLSKHRNLQCWFSSAYHWMIFPGATQGRDSGKCSYELLFYKAGRPRKGTSVTLS